MRLLAAATVAAALTLAGSASADTPTLFATVGPGFTIRVADGGGNRITRLPPGTYTVVVKDQATEHNFHLSGPGVDMATDVEATGTSTWTVSFQQGTYHYQCDPHFTVMKGDIAVEAGAPAPTSTTTPTPAPAPPVRRLAATVGASAIALKSSSGARVTRLKAGPVVIRVSDLS